MIGKIIRQRRLRMGWTMADLAEKMNVRPNTIERWEKEKVIPRIKTIVQIEKIFYMEFGSLLSTLDIEDNTKKKIFVIFAPNSDININEMCRAIIKKCPDYVVFSQRNVFSFYPKEWDRNWIFKNCRSVLIYLADEVWTFGDWQSSAEYQIYVQFAKLYGLFVFHNPSF